MARVKSRSSFFPCSETKQKSLLRRLTQTIMHNYRLPSSDGGLYGVSSQIMTIGINYGHYMVTIFYWAARQGNAQSRNTSCSYRKKTKWPTEFLENCSCLFPWGRFLRGGDASFQVVWRTDLEVDLERTQNYFVELLALFFWLRRIII